MSKRLRNLHGESSKARFDQKRPLMAHADTAGAADPRSTDSRTGVYVLRVCTSQTPPITPARGSLSLTLSTPHPPPKPPAGLETTCMRGH